ncbi:MAG: M13 family metallopeptidase [Pseudomonadota bacterium]
MKNLLLASTAFIFAAACGQGETTNENSTEAANTEVGAPKREVVTTSPDVWGEWGVDLASVKADAHAGDDFFMHVNGAWFDTFEIPADRTRYGAFDLLREKSEQQTRFIIEDLAAEKPPVGTPAGKVAAFYNAFLDTDAINSAGLAPAKSYLDKISSISDRAGLAVVFAKPGYQSPFNAFVFADSKNPNSNILQTSIGGLGLPDRDYYLNDDEKSVEQRGQYLELLTFMLNEAGYDDPASTAADVMALETAIANAHWDRALSRNPDLRYNKLSMADMEALAGDFPVDVMLATLGLGDVDEMLAAQIPPTDDELAAAGLDAAAAAKLGGGFAEVFRLANEESLDTWKAYLTAHFLIDHASVLPAEVDEAVFAFYGTALRGQPEQRERWKRGVSAVEGTLGEAIGAEFVARHFPAENKAAMDELVANLRTAMAANLEDLGWMSDETRPLAFDKLDKFAPKIGFPDEFETYEELEISDDPLSNAVAASAFAWTDSLKRLGQPVDKTEWFMTPQTVNAYYNPTFNEIVFPAAILQPPFFNISADPAVNYGAIGGVIGHEMGHGFDDQGSKFDGDGVLRNWWSDSDLEAFRELGGALAGQYDGFCPLDDGETCINGRLSLGENIGDLGGLSLAYRAYQLSLDGEEAPVLNGLTGDQRFFMAWAQVWRSKMRDEALRTQLRTGPHSPPYFRVNGIVRNMDAWYDAFGVTEEHALYLPPEERIKIW